MLFSSRTVLAVAVFFLTAVTGVTAVAVFSLFAVRAVQRVLIGRCRHTSDMVEVWRNRFHMAERGNVMANGNRQQDGSEHVRSSMNEIYSSVLECVEMAHLLQIYTYVPMESASQREQALWQYLIMKSGSSAQSPEFAKNAQNISSPYAFAHSVHTTPEPNTLPSRRKCAAYHPSCFKPVLRRNYNRLKAVGYVIQGRYSVCLSIDYQDYTKCSAVPSTT